MRYRTKVTVVTGGREYKPGTILPEDISKGDLAFLKSKGFVDPVDMAPQRLGMMKRIRMMKGATFPVLTKGSRKHSKARMKSGNSVLKRMFSTMRLPSASAWGRITRKRA